MDFKCKECGSLKIVKTREDESVCGDCGLVLDSLSVIADGTYQDLQRIYRRGRYDRRNYYTERVNHLNDKGADLFRPHRKAILATFKENAETIWKDETLTERERIREILMRTGRKYVTEFISQPTIQTRLQKELSYYRNCVSGVGGLSVTGSWHEGSYWGRKTRKYDNTCLICGVRYSRAPNNKRRCRGSNRNGFPLHNFKGEPIENLLLKKLTEFTHQCETQNTKPNYEDWGAGFFRKLYLERWVTIRRYVSRKLGWHDDFPVLSAAAVEDISQKFEQFNDTYERLKPTFPFKRKHILPTHYISHQYLRHWVVRHPEDSAAKKMLGLFVFSKEQKSVTMRYDRITSAVNREHKRGHIYTWVGTKRTKKKNVRRCLIKKVKY